MKIFGPLLVAVLLLAPAIRLLSQAHSSRRKPELFAALFFLGAGIGLPLRVYGSSIFETNPDQAMTINVIGHLAFAAGAVAMTVFTWRVFHPGSPLARVFAISAIAGIVSTTLCTLVLGFASAERSPAMIATNLARLVPTYWAFFESFRYWRTMRKRIRFGLADPIVVNRFLLWAIWTCAISVLPSIALGLRMLNVVVATMRPNLATHDFAEPVFVLLRMIFLCVAPIAAVALSLSFFPPPRYLEHIRVRAAASASAT